MNLTLAEPPLIDALKVIPGHHGITLVWSHAGETFEFDALAFALEFENATVNPGVVLDHCETEICGKMDSGEIGFTVIWSIHRAVLRKRVIFRGTPDPNWGRLLRLVVHEGVVWSGEEVDASMGWRDNAFTHECTAPRKLEEGSGRLPASGYPIFFKRGFIGLEHPMGFCHWQPESGSVRVFHHPVWEGLELASESLVIGHAPKGTTTRAAFMRYFSTIRRPRHPKASVEINTFWTDPITIDNSGIHYHVEMPAYEAIATHWVEGVFNRERGLISSLVLDAGWSDPNTIYQPKESIGGLGDNGLTQFAKQLDTLGLSLGLWISTNGLIGVSREWAQSQGYTLSNRGVGAAYSGSANTHFVALDDRRWEADFCSRLSELNAHVSVASYKCDWDNEGIISDRQKVYPLLETVWEENVNAMIRMFSAIAPRRPDGMPGPRLRGGWWLSPWWFQHVDSAHLPHSGDLEHGSLPALNPREASLNSRDMLLYEHLVKHRTPVPWDAIDNHDFPQAPRCPIVDSEESWLHTLLLWISRGAQAIQLYVPPYGIRGQKAQALRQTLRWFRDHESLFSHSSHQWIGGNPGLGEVYGFHHALGAQELLLIRNPIGSPQSMENVIPPALLQQIEGGDWSILFPYRSSAKIPRWIGSNQMLVLQRGKIAPETSAPAVKIPSLHQVGPPKISIINASNGLEHWEVQIPYDYDEAELVMEWDGNQPLAELQIAAGRYEDGVSSAIIPITWLTPHWRASYTESRSRLAPDRWGRVVARVPLPVSGTAYLTLRNLKRRPVAVWIEAGRLNPGDEKNSRHLPLPRLAREVVFDLAAP